MLFRSRKIPHNVLNAKLHQQEAQIVAEAGQSVMGKVWKVGDKVYSSQAEAMSASKASGASVTEEERLLGAVTIATNMAGRGTDIKLSP